MPRKRRRGRPRQPMAMNVLERLFMRLRKVEPDDADVVVVVHLRMDDEVKDDVRWICRWYSAHWLTFDDGVEPDPRRLPPGVAAQIAKAMSYEAAQSVGGQAFASIGASLGRAAVDEVAKRLLPNLTKQG